MSDTPPDVPAGWHTDPQGRHELRDWDGSKWTDHVSDAGVTSSDPVTPKKALFSRIESAVTIGDDQNDAAKDKVRGQVDGDGLLGTGVNARTGAGGGALFSEPVLVVNQTTKLVELNNEYSVYDQDANTIATVARSGSHRSNRRLASCRASTSS